MFHLSQTFIGNPTVRTFAMTFTTHLIVVLQNEFSLRENKTVAEGLRIRFRKKFEFTRNTRTQIEKAISYIDLHSSAAFRGYSVETCPEAKLVRRGH